MPGLSVVYPSSPYEAKGLMLSSIFSNFPTIFFESRSLHSMKEVVPAKTYFLDPTKAFVRIKGKDLTIVSFGPSVKNAMDIADKIKRQKKISCEVIDLRSINPIDLKTILVSVKKTKNLCLIEHGWPNASISSDIISKVTERIRLKRRPIKFCWPNSYTPTTHSLEKKYYFSDEKIMKDIIYHQKKNY